MQTTRLDRCNDCNLGFYAVTGLVVVVVVVVVVMVVVVVVAAVGAIMNQGIITEKLGTVVP